ncbi:MAG: T9SS type A sorting domain-containing protein [bacterium]
MKRIATTALVAALVVMLAGLATADVITSPWAMRFFGEAFVNGSPAPVGSVIDAYDPDGVHCGTFTVGDVYDTVGIYGYMPVYGDDPYSADIDEGADDLDEISFRINGRPATPTAISGDLLWRDGTSAEVDLAVGDAIVAVSLVDSPADKEGAPGQTLRFWVGVQNDGNGLDFYGIEVTSTLGWTTTAQTAFEYAGVGGTAYLYFDVQIPLWPGMNLVDELNFAVFSQIDPAAFVEGSVHATAAAGTSYAVALTAAPGNRMVMAGELVHVEVGVTNTGNMPDSYEIMAGGILQGWTVTPMAGFVSANPGEEVFLSFQVSVPMNALPTDINTITYDVTSTSSPAATVGGMMTLTPDVPTDVDDGDWALVPDQVSLAQNYPNPFNPTTTIAFSLPERSKVTITVIDILGRTVNEIDMGELAAGTHETIYDASALASGMYFYRLDTELGRQTRKMILLK